MTDVTYEGREVLSADFHVEGKNLWVKLTLREGKDGTQVYDIELERSKSHEIKELGGLEARNK